MGLSVVIPCYNVEATIGEQLEALLGQEWPGEWEVVVVDNGSTDRTRDVVGAFAAAHPRLRVVQATAGQSISYARNAGVRAAHFDAIAICDGDDVVGPGWVAAMGDALASVTSSSPAGSRSTGSILRGWLNSRGRPRDGLDSFWGIFPRVPGCNHGFRRAVWERMGGFDESLPQSPRPSRTRISALRAWEAGLPADVRPGRPRPLPLPARRAVTVAAGAVLRSRPGAHRAPAPGSRL